MKRRHVAPLAVFALYGASLAALLAVTGAQPAYAVVDVNHIRPSQTSGDNAPLSFTTFEQEERAISQSLPCKWISKDGRVGPSYGSGRYDYLCKGGDFATISLYLDKAGVEGVGKIRLMYRDWLPSANPNAADAQTAMQFLQHVTGRFVPAAQAHDVAGAFWGRKTQRWQLPGVNVVYEYEMPRGASYALRKLTIESREVALRLRDGSGYRKPEAPPTEILIYDEQGNLVRRGAAGLQVTPPQPVVTPTDAGLSKPETTVLPQPAPHVLPKPVGYGFTPVPGMAPNRAEGQLTVPSTAPAGPLEKATPSELVTTPDPESLQTPPAPPAPSENLVPTVDDLVSGKGKAPSNFDIYNRATELTKDVEEKAQVTKVQEARVTASQPESQGATVPVEAAPSLKPLPTPGAQANMPKNAGLTVPQQAEPSALPPNYQGPRSTQERPLPQLKFIPKAEPVHNPTEVIKFEDESSAL